MIARKYYISGRVQGVFFRAFTRDHARRLGLTGYVKNLSDGRVEAYAEGPEKAVEELQEKMRTGPEHARVDDVEIIEEKPENKHELFGVKY